MLCFSPENMGKRFDYGFSGHPFVPEFQFYPASSVSPEPYPAGSPLLREMPVIDIPHPLQVVNNRFDDRRVKTLVEELPDDLSPAARTVSKEPVSGVPGPGEFFIMHVTAPTPSLPDGQ